MNYLEQQYSERFTEIMDIQHKITVGTEKATFHLHPDLEIIYALSGNLVFCTEAERIPIPAGSIVLINSMLLHHIDYVHDGAHCDRHVLFFKPDVASRMNTPEVNLLGCFVYQKKGPVFLRCDGAAGDDFIALLNRMEAQCKGLKSEKPSENPFFHHAKQLTLQLMLGEVLVLVNEMYRKQFSVEHTPSFEAHSQLAMEICRYIDANLSEDLSMDDLAHQFLISKTQMFNVFKDVLKLSVGNYIQDARMIKAKDDLINTNYSIEIISQRVGYSSIASFSRVFKARVGLSPLQYRKQKGIME